MNLNHDIIDGKIALETVYHKLQKAKSEDKKLIPIEWAEEIRDNAQSIVCELESLITKIKLKNYLLDLITDFIIAWDYLGETGKESKKIDYYIDMMRKLIEPF